jgi:lipoyl-dependent peroxiredoxin
MKRTATATWKGSLKEGEGRFSASSGAFSDLAYSFRTRFEDEPGTNPEELIAAAHSACFSMALSAELGKAGVTPESVETTANVTLEPVDGAPTVTKSRLTVVATIPGGSEDVFRQAAEDAKKGCPISRLLNAEITLDAQLKS